MGDNHREMNTYEQMTLALKAIEVSGRAKDKTPEEIIVWAKEICAVSFKTERVKSIQEETASEEDISRIYAAYPSKDVRNRNRPTGKGEKSRKIIAKKLTEGYTVDFILKAISDVLESSSYLKDFNTFLNNLPCRDDMFASEGTASDPYHF